MKRNSSGLSGVIAVDKPAGITSHDVVDCVRRMAHERRVGHAGTLDPQATGLMFVCIGAATRLSQYLMGHDKSYVAHVVFGLSTDTDDCEGRVMPVCGTEEARRPAEVVARFDPQSTVAGLVGPQMQLPPAYSAIKKNGVVAYKAAREGTALELEARPVTVRAAQFLGSGTEQVSVADGEGGYLGAELPYWDIAFTVSKGTYIRALARDLGLRMGCGAYLGDLRRVSVAGVSVNEALTLEGWADVFGMGRGIPWVDPVKALGFESRALDERQVADVQNGRRLSLDAGDGPVCCVSGGKLLALYERDGGGFKPAAVIPGGVAGVA